MASEFDFLRVKWPKLAAMAADAGRLVDISPSSALNSLQTYCQWCADIALDIYEIQVPGGSTLMEKLEALQASGFAPAEVLQRFHNIRSAAGRTLQEMRSAAELARACMKDAKEIGQWLFREADKEGWPRNEGYAPRYGRIPIENMAGMPAYDPEMGGGGGGGFSRLTRRYGPAVTLVVGLLAVAGLTAGIFIAFSKCSANKEPALLTPSPPVWVSSTTPPVTALTPTVEPTPTEEPYDYIDELATTVKWDELFVSHWNYNQNTNSFKMNGEVYDHGVGMFIDSNTILEEHAHKEAAWTLAGKYDRISFDLGSDEDFGRWDVKAICGNYKVTIECDGRIVYETQYVDYQYFVSETSIPISVGDTNPQRMVIRLDQNKGERCTLNVVLGNFKLYEDPDLASSGGGG